MLPAAFRGPLFVVAERTLLGSPGSPRNVIWHYLGHRVDVCPAPQSWQQQSQDLLVRGRSRLSDSA